MKPSTAESQEITGAEFDARVLSDLFEWELPGTIEARGPALIKIDKGLRHYAWH